MGRTSSAEALTVDNRRHGSNAKNIKKVLFPIVYFV